MNRMTHIPLLAALALSSATCAASDARMSFTGTLVEPPPCQINNGARIEVPFHEIGIDTIDGVNHRKSVPLSLSCQPQQKWDLVLTLSGATAGFERATLQTSMPGLGIQLWLNGQPFDPDIMFIITDTPRLEAVPVRHPGIILTEGDFDAAATLTVAYQ
jgi:type 1 fimbria pilin